MPSWPRSRTARKNNFERNKFYKPYFFLIPKPKKGQNGTLPGMAHLHHKT